MNSDIVAVHITATWGLEGTAHEREISLQSLVNCLVGSLCDSS